MASIERVNQYLECFKSHRDAKKKREFSLTFSLTHNRPETETKTKDRLNQGQKKIIRKSVTGATAAKCVCFVNKVIFMMRLLRHLYACVSVTSRAF